MIHRLKKNKHLWILLCFGSMWLTGITPAFAEVMALNPEHVPYGTDIVYDSVHAFLSKERARVNEKRTALFEQTLNMPPAERTRAIEDYRVKLADVIGMPTVCRESSPAKLIKEEAFVETDQYRIVRLILSVCDDQLHTYGLLGIPKNISTPRPLVIAVHGTAASPERIFGLDDPKSYTVVEYHHEFAMRLLKEGYVVYAPLWITSKIKEEKIGYEEYTNAVNFRAQPLGWQFAGITVGMMSRTIDYLEALPYVQKDKIGAYGISGGGTLVQFLAGLDKRIYTSVVSQWIEDRSVKLSGFKYKLAMWRYPNAGWVVIPNYLERFDSRVLSMLIAPRKLLVEAGIKDGTRAESAKQIFPDIKRIYDKLGVEPDSTCLDLNPAAHEIYYENARFFLAYWLKGSGKPCPWQ